MISPILAPVAGSHETPSERDFFVGNLPESKDRKEANRLEAELLAFFRPHGAVSFHIENVGQTYAYGTMRTPDEAANAIKDLHNTRMTLLDQDVTISVRPKTVKMVKAASPPAPPVVPVAPATQVVPATPAATATPVQPALSMAAAPAPALAAARPQTPAVKLEDLRFLLDIPDFADSYGNFPIGIAVLAGKEMLEEEIRIGLDVPNSQIGRLDNGKLVLVDPYASQKTSKSGVTSFVIKLPVGINKANLAITLVRNGKQHTTILYR